MKTLAIILLTMTLNIACAQIVSIESTPLGNSPNTYYKDTNDVLNHFEGTWKYTSGTTELTLVIQKKVHFHYAPLDTYYDYLVGEYKYIENGVEIVNTLDRLDNTNLGLFDHGLSGNRVLFKNLQEFTDSSASLVIMTKFKDFDREYIDTKSNIQWSNGSPNQIKFVLRDGNNIIPYAGAPMDTRVPGGDYILIKQ